MVSSRSVHFLALVLIPATVAGCVSRYSPLEPIDPLSGQCRDYAAFSKALAVQRDHGFTKRATLSMAGYSVGGQENQGYLIRHYKTVSEIIFTDYLIRPASIQIFGRIVCEQRKQQTWVVLGETDYKPVSEIIRFCQNDNFSEPDTEQCIKARLVSYHNRNDIPPPYELN